MDTSLKRRVRMLLASMANPIGALLIMGLAVGAAPSSLKAQATVVGRVIDADSGRPLPGAAVLVQGTDQGTLTSDDGRFLITGLGAGVCVLEARMLGYRTTTQAVDVSAEGAVQVEFSLTTRPIEVGGIQVSVLRPDLQPQAKLTEREVREVNPKDSGHLLRAVDGVDAVRRGALGLDPVVRGLRETEVGTYLDGTRLFPAGPGRMDSPLTHLDPSAVQEIEVVKGPYALTWGAGNLSAVRVATAPLPPRGNERPTGTLSTGYDSNLRASEASGSLAARTGPLSFWAHGVGREGNDYTAGGSSEKIPAGYSSYEGRGKVGMDVGESSMITLSGGYQHQGQTDYPGRLMTALWFNSTNFGAQWDTHRTDGLFRNFELAAYRNRVKHKMDNRDKPSAAMNHVEVDTGIEVWGGRASAELVTDSWTTRIGGDLYRTNRNADRTIQPLTGPMAGSTMNLVIWPDADITDLGLFSQTSRTLDSGVRLSGTLRVDQVWSSANRPSASFLDFLERTDGAQKLDETETNVSAALTAGFDVGSHWDLSVGLGSAVRTADATERYSDHQPSTKSQFTAEFMGNPGLAPERSTQADLWLEASYPRMTFQLNTFGRRVSDYITLALTNEAKRQQMPIFPATVYRYANGDAVFYGGEASMAYGLTDVLTLDTGLSYLWGRETAFPTTDSSVEVEEPAIGVAPTTGRVGLRYEERRGRYFLQETTRIVGKQTRVASTRGELPTDGYTLVDVRGGFSPIRGVSLAFGVENLFDKGYVNHLNSKNPFTGLPVPEPGRVLYIDASYAF